MRGGNWIMPAAFLAALCVAVGARAGDTDPARPPKKEAPWYKRCFGLGAKEKKDEARVEKDPVKKDAPAAKPAADPFATLRARAEADYLRRLAVCNRLMQTAFDSQDEELQRQVEQLEDRVWSTYQQQMARLSTGGAGDSDEEILDKHLGTAAAPRDKQASLLFRKHEQEEGKGRTASNEETKP